MSNARALLRHSRSSSAGDRVGDDPGARLQRGLAVAPDHRADGDRGVEVAGEVDVADHARRTGPRLIGSSSSMISIARTLGAPLTVPAGNVARSTSTGALAVGEVARRPGS